MRFDAIQVRRQIEQLLLQFPELLEDEVLRADTVEGATDLHQVLRVIERQRQEAKALAAAIAQIIDDLTQRANRFARRDEGLRKLMFGLLEAADLKRVELPEATISIRAGVVKVIILDEAALPKTFLRVRTEPDKQLIKTALTDGVRVEGATLSNAEATLTIRIK